MARWQEDYGPLTAYDGQMKVDIDFVVVVPHRTLGFCGEGRVGFSGDLNPTMLA